MNMDRITQIEDEWESIDKDIRIAPYESPLNRDEERERVIRALKRGESYDPQFRYQETPDYPIERIRDFISSLHADSDIEMLYLNKARLQLLQIERVQSKSPDIITASTGLSYGFPSKELITEAKQILSTASERNVTATDILATDDLVAQLVDELDKARIDGWTVLVSNLMNSKIAVNRKDKEVKIREGVRFSRQDLRRLLVHEIGVHVLRFENGTQQPIRLFATSFPGYLSTEEGLAVFCEDKANLLRRTTLHKYACRALGAQLVLYNTFFEAFHELTKYVAPEESFEIILRAKRGITDTSQYGGNTKDIVYLKGLIEVREHLNANPNDFELLFAGKFGLQHLPLVKSLMSMGILKPVEKLPAIKLYDETESKDQEVPSS